MRSPPPSSRCDVTQHRPGQAFPAFRLMTPQNVVMLLCGASLYFGAILRQPALLSMGTAFLVAPLMGWLRASRLLTSLRVERIHHPRAFEEQVLPVHLRVRSVSGDPATLVAIEDDFPPGASYRLRLLLPQAILAGRTIDIEFTPQCVHKRGLYVLGPVRLTGSDPLGFFRREQVVEHLTQLVLYPNSVDLNEADLLGEGTMRHVGMEAKRRAGHGEEFMGVRDHRAGDALRTVHWRSTARMRRLMAKEFQELVVTRVTLFLDLGRKGLVGVGDQTSTEYAVKAAAAVAKRTFALGHELEMFSVSAQVDHLPPGTGEGHLLALLDRLAFLKAAGDTAFPVVVGDLVNWLPRGGTAVLVAGATTIDLAQWEPILEAMARRHVRPIFVLIDDRAFLKVFGEQEMRHARAMKLEALAGELTLRGGAVRIIRKARSIPEALQRGLERDEFVVESLAAGGWSAIADPG